MIWFKVLEADRVAVGLAPSDSNDCWTLEVFGFSRLNCQKQLELRLWHVSVDRRGRCARQVFKHVVEELRSGVTLEKAEESTRILAGWYRGRLSGQTPESADAPSQKQSSPRCGALKPQENNSDCAA